MFVDILQNAALLCIASVGVYWIFQATDIENNLAAPIALGMVYGVTTFLVTVTPITLDDGATIDARAGPVIVAGMIGGPSAALIAAISGAFARWYVGGSFAFSGVIVYFLYAFVGIIVWRRWMRGVLGGTLDWKRVTTGCLLGIGSAGLMFFLIEPREVAIGWIQRDFPWIAVANTLSVVLSTIFAGVAMSAAQKRANLTQTLQTLELAKQAGGIGLWTYDLTTGRVSWDATNKALHGLNIEGEYGDFSDWRRTVHPEDTARVEQTLEKALEGGAAFDTEYRVIKPDGTVCTLKGNALVQRNNSGKPLRVVGTNFDLTPILEKDKELQETRSIAAQAQRLDTIGKLTGGVAHDFNNLLAIIQGNLELLLHDEDIKSLPEQERLDMLTAAISATRRGGELTRSMLAFAKKSKLDPQPVHINDVVRETETWIARAIPSTIRIETSLQHSVWGLSLDLASLQSAIVNIIVNARDAMPDGGELTIETTNVRIDKEYIQQIKEDVPEGRYVMLAITDTGTGIDPSLLPDVFEPFVSSKHMSVGSGLGLSMVQGFARQSGGFVKLYSEVGVGTCVKLFFPSTDDEPQSSESMNRANAISPLKEESRGRILVAEDQIEVLAVVVRTLKSAGYEVDAAPNGDEAYKMFRHNRPYDLLLTDVVMPGDLLGPELARACRELEPDLPVVFMSGYASEATVHGNGLRPDDIRLMKPVPRFELLQTIQNCLEVDAAQKMT